jgi:hypothetical protein
LLLIQIAQPKEKKKKEKTRQQQLALAQMFRTSSTWNYSVTDSNARPITYNIKKKKKKKKSNNNKLLNMMMIFAYSP